MKCQNYCRVCEKDYKQCEDWKERKRAVDRALYQAKKNREERWF